MAKLSRRQWAPATGKLQRKPLDLLKALIALGGEEVQLKIPIEALWPDAEGGSAQQAFDTALYRLRKLLEQLGRY